MPRRSLSQADAAEIVLSEARRPLHRTQITEEIRRRGLPVWGAGRPGKTPEESVGRALTQEIARLRESARFEYVNGKGSGIFQLRPRSRPPGVADSSEVRRHRGDDARRGEPSAGVPGVTVTVPRELIDEVVRIGVEPTDFVRAATKTALAAHKRRLLEAAHERGYQLIPVGPDEFSDPDSDAWDAL